MNLKKEIKLSDLVPRLKKSEEKQKAKAAKPSKARGTRKREAKRKPRELVGLKIGASQLTAARIVSNGSREVLQLAREPLPQGIVVAGEVRDPVGLGEALSAFFAKNRLPRKGVRLGLANTRIGVRLIEIAGIDDQQQLENAIRFQAHEALSVPLEEAVIDWHVVSEDADVDGVVTRRILLVVGYRDSVDRYLEATDQAGLELAGIDLEAFALLRAVADPVPEEERLEAALVAVSVGHERTTLAISDGRVCEFTRVLEWGASDLTAAIARALKISPSEAEEFRRGFSFEQSAAPADEIDRMRYEQATEAARFELQALVRELLSSLRFYQAQPGSLAIGEILLAGGTADTPGFAVELERELGVSATVADPLSRVRLAASVERPERVAALAVAVGLGIED